MEYLIKYKYKDKLGILHKEEKYCDNIDYAINTIQRIDYYGKKIIYFKIKKMKKII